MSSGIMPIICWIMTLSILKQRLVWVLPPTATLVLQGGLLSTRALPSQVTRNFYLGPAGAHSWWARAQPAASTAEVNRLPWVDGLPRELQANGGPTMLCQLLGR